MRILSFGHYLQGPAATQYLTDMGADAVKVEPLGGAFERRPLAPELLPEGRSALFLAANRNQRSLAIDLKQPDGRDAILRLVRRYDVVIENYRPGVMDKLGIGYEDLKAVKGDVIYASASGYGPVGPMASAPNQDILAQAESGLIAAAGPSATAPAAVGAAVTDQHAAALLALGVAGAYGRRLATGQGGLVEGNLFSAAVDLQMEAFTAYLNRAPAPSGGGMERDARLANWYHPAPYGIYTLADGVIALSIVTAEQLCAALKRPELDLLKALDPYRDRDRFARCLAGVLAALSYDEVSGAFTEHGIWFARVSGYDALERHPQLAANRTVVEVALADGPLRLVSHPLRYDGEVPEPRRPPPDLGAGGRAVLAEGGFERQEIEDLIDRGIVAACGDGTRHDPAPAVTPRQTRA